MLEAMQQWKDGHVGFMIFRPFAEAILTGGFICVPHFFQLRSARIPIKRCRRLAACGNAEVSLAVNGRVGRRVACLLDNTGTAMETLDLEGDGEDVEGEDDAEADDGEA